MLMNSEVNEFWRSEEFWKNINDNEMIIFDHKGDEENIVVPEEIDSKPVVKLESLGKNQAKSVKIPKCVKYVSDYAFKESPDDITIYMYETTEFPNTNGYNIIYLKDEEIINSVEEDSSTTETSTEIIIPVNPDPQPSKNNNDKGLGAIVFIIAFAIVGVGFLVKTTKKS